MNSTPLFRTVQRRVASAATGLLLVLALAGCSGLTQPNSASFASVVIENRSAAEIKAATEKVFGVDGWQGRTDSYGQMIFEKEASRGTTMSREGVVGAYYGSTTINRVRAQLVPLSGGVYRLQCKAYVVRGAGDNFFEDEVPLAHIRSGPYQKLLDDVEEQLKSETPQH